MRESAAIHWEYGNDNGHSHPKGNGNGECKGCRTEVRRYMGNYGDGQCERRRPVRMTTAYANGDPMRAATAYTNGNGDALGCAADVGDDTYGRKACYGGGFSA
jgi:hypothetical protein